MRFSPLLALTLTLAATAMNSRGEDAADKALNEARAFTKAGEYAKALERHEWYHKNALSVNPALYGVRLSFALSDWKSLGEKYPPALASLKATRNAGVEALVAGTASQEVFHDVSSINRVLEQDDSTVVVFKELDAKQPALAKKCFPMVQETLLEKGEVDLFTRHAGDLSAYMQTQIARYRQITDHMKSGKVPRLASLLKLHDDDLVATALQLARIANDKGDKATAEEIREMTAKVVPDMRLEAAK